MAATADKVIAAYVMIRGQRSEIKQAYEAEDKILKEKMEKLDTWLLAKFEEIGSDQFKSPHGVAFRQITTQVSCSDWTNFWPKMAELGRYDFMQKRLSAKAVQDYLAEEGHEDLPGITTFHEYKVGIRRA
jgi:hypothetical protein